MSSRSRLSMPARRLTPTHHELKRDPQLHYVDLVFDQAGSDKIAVTIADVVSFGQLRGLSVRVDIAPIGKASLEERRKSDA